MPVGRGFCPEPVVWVKTRARRQGKQPALTALQTWAMRGEVMAGGTC
jgi:hypothetical protein